MSWFMSIAAGAAAGYFLYQFIIRGRNVNEEEKSGNRGRLHRSSKNKQIAGVCGGIAEYLNADPTIVRLVTILLVFGWGSGLLAYIVCALVMPEE